MNFYSFHIGDYAAHTRHLTPIEDIAYRRMIDLYYTSERPLPLDTERLARLIGLREHMQEVSAVVTEFFTKADDGFRSKRCDEEIAIYRHKIEQASRAGTASAERRRNTSSTGVQRPFNAGSTDEQPTNPKNQSQEPIPRPSKKHTSADASVVMPDAIDQQAWEAFVTHRKQIRKKLTPLAAKKQIDFLIQYDKPTQRAIVDQTVRNGWVGLFEPKGGSQHASQSPEQQRVARLSKSAAGRVQLNAERELADIHAARQGSDRAPVADHDQDIRPQVDVVVR